MGCWIIMFPAGQTAQKQDKKKQGQTEEEQTGAGRTKQGRQSRSKQKCVYLRQNTPPVIPHRRLVVRQELVASRAQDNLVVNVGNIYLRSRLVGGMSGVSKLPVWLWVVGWLKKSPKRVG
jgi:hypothetical protein